MVYGISGLSGIIIGTVCCLLFFQSAEKWNKSIASFIGLGGTIASYKVIQQLTGATKLEELQVGFFVLLVFLIISMVLTFLFCCNLIKEKDGEGIIRVRDILLGQHEYIKEVYRKRAEALHHASMFEAERKALEAERKAFEADKAEFWQMEKNLQNRENMLNEQRRNMVALQLPICAVVPITNEYLGEFPDYIERLAKFMSDVHKLTDEYCHREIPTTNKGKYGVLHSYFLAICTFAMEDIFDTSKNVRIHFRYLEGDFYVKLVAKIGKNVYEDELTPMPKEGTFISKSFDNKSSLVRSLNLHEKYHAGDNRNVWEDFLTIAFYGICKEGLPFVSMGISVKNKERYKHLLYFLNFYKLENFIQEELMKFNKVYDVIGIIEANSKERNGGI